jgi:histidyl-tRNA synthetase
VAAAVLGLPCWRFNKIASSLKLLPMAVNFQAPKGTRDFYPSDMAVRRYMEDIWRKVSIRHGFQEVDGPTFESLDLYKVKSGDEIVSQLFSFTDRGERELALRPEFTPTLARMVAQKAAGLPRPVKWFSIPRCYRAEQPQKGRLREFIQWNVDFIGDATDRADRECLAVCVDALLECGLTAADIHIGWNHRELLTRALESTFVAPGRIGNAYYILDRLQKYDAAARQALYQEQQCNNQEREHFERIAAAGNSPQELAAWMNSWPAEVKDAIALFQKRLGDAGLAELCRFDLSVVRGLAYYTGFVFEVVDAQGNNRAIAGGGRYDRLIEMFGGPAMPAVGFGMGDVVLEILLRERNKLPAQLMPPADVFVINVMEDSAAADQLTAQLRRSQWNTDQTAITRPGLNVQTSYRSTRNIGKLLQEASGCGARMALILAPDEVGRGVLKLKNLADRSEMEIPLDTVLQRVHELMTT